MTSLWLANRFRLGARTGSVIAVAGIALAVVVMLLSIAVLTGFKEAIAGRVTAFEAPVSLSAMGLGQPDASGMNIGAAPIAPEAWLGDALAGERGVEVVPVAARPVMLKTAGDFRGVMLKGYPDTYEFDFLTAHIVAGEMPPPRGREQGPWPIAVSRSVADALGLEPGERLQACFFADAAEGGALKVRPVVVSGIFDTRFGDYDRTFVYSRIGLPASVDRLPEGSGTRLELHGVADADIDRLAARLQDAAVTAYYSGRTPTPARVDSSHRSAAIYFNWLAMLDTNVTVILALMAAVGAFTLVSSLFILVLERVSTIGLLKALGATDGQVRRVFILLCERLVVRGLLIGDATALLLVWLQHTTRFIPLDPATYYIAYVPVHLGVWPVAWLNVAVIAIAALVLVLPSHIVATISPSRTLRYA